MKAADVMVTDVVTVHPDVSVQEVAGILLAHRISGVPVVDGDGALVGIVSEGDMLRHADAGTAQRTSWWLRLLADNRGLAADYIKSHSRKVADVMTRRVVTAAPDTPVGEIAGLLEKHGIKRVPIVDNGKLVGLVSRANLIQALASLRRDITAGERVDDAKIRASIMGRLKAEPWRPWLLNVVVRDGTVDIWGLVDSEEEKTAARVAIEVTPGVRDIANNLIVRPHGAAMT